MVRVLVFTVMLVATVSRAAYAQTIAVFSDSVGSSTCIETSLPPFLDLYILFVPGGQAVEMQGAQFRLKSRVNHSAPVVTHVGGRW